MAKIRNKCFIDAPISDYAVDILTNDLKFRVEPPELYWATIKLRKVILHLIYHLLHFKCLKGSKLFENAGINFLSNASLPRILIPLYVGKAYENLMTANKLNRLKWHISIWI